MRLLMVLVVLVLLALGGLAGFAWFGDMAARTRPMSVPVPLHVDTAAPPAAAVPAPAPAAPASAPELPPANDVQE